MTRQNLRRARSGGGQDGVVARAPPQRGCLKDRYVLGSVAQDVAHVFLRPLSCLYSVGTLAIRWISLRESSTVPAIELVR